MNFALDFILIFLSVLLIFLGIWRISLNSFFEIGGDYFDYRNKLLSVRVYFCEIDDVRLEKGFVGLKIVLKGDFNVRVNGLGIQSRKIFEIHESKNFDIRAVVKFIESRKC